MGLEKKIKEWSYKLELMIEQKKEVSISLLVYWSIRQYGFTKGQVLKHLELLEDIGKVKIEDDVVKLVE